MNCTVGARSQLYWPGVVKKWPGEILEQYSADGARVDPCPMTSVVFAEDQATALTSPYATARKHGGVDYGYTETRDIHNAPEAATEALDHDLHPINAVRQQMGNDQEGDRT